MVIHSYVDLFSLGTRFFLPDVEVLGKVGVH
jgi:hypothetical protein